MNPDSLPVEINFTDEYSKQAVSHIASIFDALDPNKQADNLRMAQEFVFKVGPGMALQFTDLIYRNFKKAV